jgi:hypothetical protein
VKKIAARDLPGIRALKLTPNLTGAIFIRMLTKKISAILLFAALTAATVSCGSFQLIYPIDAPDTTAQTKKGKDTNAAATAVPQQPAAKGDRVAELVDVQPGTLAPNSLTRVFTLEYAKGFDKVVEAMFTFSLISVDKGSGVIITDWIVDNPKNQGDMMGVDLFGGSRAVRYKYMVKVSDSNGATEVTVAPHAQYTKDRKWVDATPKIVVAETLMKKIIARLEN